MRAALVLVDWNEEKSYCHVLKGDNPLEAAHALFQKIRGEFPDCDFAFVSDEAAKRRYGDRAFRRSASLSQQAVDLSDRTPYPLLPVEEVPCEK